MAWGLGLFLIAVPYSLLYGVVSRLPMSYAMVHMTYDLKLTGMVPACLFGAYCIGRLLGAICTSSFFGLPTMLAGTLAGLVSHLGILIDLGSPVVFGVMVAMAGFTETVTGIDVILKLEAVVQDLGEQDEQRLFRVHFVAVTAGAVGAYVGGGRIYDVLGIEGICWIGIGCAVLQTCLLLVYAWPRRKFYSKCFPSIVDVITEMEDKELDVLEVAERELSAQEGGVSELDGVETGEANEVEAVQEGRFGKEARRQPSIKSLSSQRMMSERRQALEARISRRSIGSRRSLGSGRRAHLLELAMAQTEKFPGEEAQRSSRPPVLEAIGRALGCVGGKGRQAGRRRSLTQTVADPLGIESLEAALAQAERPAEDLQGEDVAALSASHQEGPSAKVPALYSGMTPQERLRVTMAGWTLVLSYFVTAFPIGQNFALMPLFWKVVWGKSTTVCGAIMSLGEILGLAILVPLASKRVCELPIFRPFRRPMNLVLATLASSGFVFVVIYPNMWVSAVGCVCVHIVNVLLHTFCNEITAAWIPPDVYPMWVGRCYIAKRASNTVMAFVCTSLFTYVSARAPFIVVGSAVGVWGVVLVIVYDRYGYLPWQDWQDVGKIFRRQREKIRSLERELAVVSGAAEGTAAAMEALEARFNARMVAMQEELASLSKRLASGPSAAAAAAAAVVPATAVSKTSAGSAEELENIIAV